MNINDNADGDGWKGIPGEKFDAIHVGAAASELPPALVEQMNLNAKMVIPIGTTDQNLYLIKKDEHGHLTKQLITGVRFVPLVRDKRD